MGTWPDQRTRLEERDRVETARDVADAKWARFHEPPIEGEITVESPVQMFRRKAKDETTWTRILLYQAANYMESLERENETLKAQIRDMETR